MYCKEKQSKPRKTHRNQPSFSSSLLDEICRSIDGGGPPENRETPPSAKPRTTRRDEEAARFPRACLVDKRTHRARKSDNSVFPDNDPPFSASTSSDSSGALSSSDTEFFAKRPNPIRTSRKCDNILFDDYQNYEKNNDHAIKSKSKVLKIYAQLKKLKQPISPGAKLTSLINSFFAKKSKKDGDLKTRNAVDRDCGGRSSYDVKKFGSNGRPPLPPNVVRVGDQRRRDLSFFGKTADEDEDEDGASESSSDLFELDHLSLFGKSDRFCEELPVYGTTYFDMNHRLIR